MALDVAWLLDLPEFCVKFGVERAKEGVNDKGRAEFQAERLALTGVIQPATPRELERLPEGDRDRESIAVFAREPLSLGQGPEGSAPDVILWKGQRYEVASVESWPGYWRAIATLLPRGESL